MCTQDLIRYPMKPFFTLFIFFTLTVLSTQAQATYNITSDAKWNASIPLTCSKCTINISTGVTLTINKDVVCQDCTFNGGNISMGNKTLTLQTSGGSTHFNNVNFDVTSKGTITGSAPIYISNSVFSFAGSSELNSQQLLDISGNSWISFATNSDLLATGGPVNLSGNTVVVVGDGKVGNSASIEINGPALNINGAAGIVISGPNDYYFNWNTYKGNGTTYTTTPNVLNCGTGHPHSCSAPLLYGGATLTSSGISLSTALPVVLSGYSATLQNNHTVYISWTTEQESNSANFSIERSTDGSNWTAVGSVNAKGNSSTATNYSFTDGNPATGINQYRLKVADRDGSYVYSDVKTVKNELPTNISIFPNPTHDFVNVTVGQSPVNSVRLMNANGQLLQEVTVNNRNNGVVSMPVQKYSAGIYVVQISHTDGSSQSSVLIINGK